MSSASIRAFEVYPEDRLDSWKEIAAYLRRGLRTVQRWEREVGLPVHRLHHDQGSTVYAFRSELNRWLNRSRTLEAVPELMTVAVLPFADLSPARDWEFFCEGLADEIMNALSPVDGVRVASRTSTRHYRSVSADSREIGRQLGVRILVEGSVRAWEDRLRIAVQLVDGASGFPVWTGRIDRDAADLFGAQEAVAREIATQMQPFHRKKWEPASAASRGLPL